MIILLLLRSGSLSWLDVQSRVKEIKEQHRGKHFYPNMLSYGLCWFKKSFNTSDIRSKSTYRHHYNFYNLKIIGFWLLFELNNFGHKHYYYNASIELNLHKALPPIISEMKGKKHFLSPKQRFALRIITHRNHRKVLHCRKLSNQDYHCSPQLEPIWEWILKHRWRRSTSEVWRKNMSKCKWPWEYGKKGKVRVTETIRHRDIIEEE